MHPSFKTVYILENGNLQAHLALVRMFFAVSGHIFLMDRRGFCENVEKVGVTSFIGRYCLKQRFTRLNHDQNPLWKGAGYGNR